MSEVKAIFIVQRHGARFPSHGQLNNMSFPRDSEFWNKYSMQLTPRGMEQLRKFGEQVQLYYPNLTSKGIAIFSSNTSRTILSSLSTLDGIEPNNSHYIQYGYADRFEVPGSVKIVVEKSDYDPLFRLNRDKNREWYYNNLKQSRDISRLLEDNFVKLLLDKLYTLTHCERIDPCLPRIERLSGITTCVNLLRYAKAHNSVAFPNSFNLELTEKEKEAIILLGDIVYDHRFNSHDKLYSNELGTRRCGMILDEICRRMILPETQGIYIYSCHDTNILAIAASFGLSIPCPDFASYYIFELTNNGKVSVKINTRPNEYNLEDLQSIYWKKSKFVTKLSDCEVGSFPVDEFLARFSREDYRRFSKDFTLSDLSPLMKDYIGENLEEFKLRFS